jgi:hypothetical protein
VNVADCSKGLQSVLTDLMNHSVSRKAFILDWLTMNYMRQREI